MKLKYPLVIDIADVGNSTTKYNPITRRDDIVPPDWSAAISPMPDAVICKATEGNYINDQTFESNWRQLGEKGVPRGAYHFARFGRLWEPAAQQAKFFLAAVNRAGGLKNGDVLVLDTEEEGYMSAQAIVDFLWQVESMTGNRPLIYSRALLLNNLNLGKLKSAQQQYIHETPLWMAGTFNNADAMDNFDAPPKIFIPDQTRWGKVVLWQYGLDVNPAGLLSGIPGGLDFNWVDPQFFTRWKSLTVGTPLPPVPPAAPHLVSITAGMSDSSSVVYNNVKNASITFENGDIKIL